MDYAGSVWTDKGQNPMFFGRLHYPILLAPTFLTEISLVKLRDAYSFSELYVPAKRS